MSFVLFLFFLLLLLLFCFCFSCEQSSQAWQLLQTKKGFVISAFEIIHKRKIKGKNHACSVAVGSFVLRWPAAIIISPQKCQLTQGSSRYSKWRRKGDGICMWPF